MKAACDAHAARRSPAVRPGTEADAHSAAATPRCRASSWRHAALSAPATRVEGRRGADPAPPGSPGAAVVVDCAVAVAVSPAPLVPPPPPAAGAGPDAVSEPSPGKCPTKAPVRS